MFDRPAMLGQVNIVSRMGQAGAPSGGQGQATGGGGGMPGGPSVSVAHQFSSPGAPLNFSFSDFGWGWPPYYNYPIYQPPAAPARMICRKLEEASEREGTEIFECRQEVPQYATYPQYSVYPLTYVRPPYRWPYRWF